MIMMDELKHMFLYSAKRKVYAPINEFDKRRGSAILLLTPRLETSIKLMDLSYMYNPNLFYSFYVDRNVMAYIDNVDVEVLDEREEEALSEAMMKESDVRFIYDETTSTMDKKYTEDVFNRNNVKRYAKMLNLNKLSNPKIKVKIYHNLSDIRKVAPRRISDQYNDKLYSYSDKDTIHIVSKMIYDPDIMGGTYDMYLNMELINYLISHHNPNIHFDLVKAVASSLSGRSHWIEKNDNSVEIFQFDKLAHSIDIITEKEDYKILIKFINYGNIDVIASYIATNTLKNIKKLLSESELSYMERQRLSSSQFGIPDKRKYPMPDEEHVRLAIKMFNHCDADEEEELAKAIIKRINNFGITDIKVGANNRFRKYYKEDKKKNESTLLESSFLDSDYADILKICSNISKEELNRITFYDTYRNSPFVAKRIIHRVGSEPAGFLDVYIFPSKPDVAQIVIAVDKRFRNSHIADKIIDKLMFDNKFAELHKFAKYYWAAHPDNKASQSLAEKHGFMNTNIEDKYGRIVFIKSMTPNPVWNEMVSNLPIHSGMNVLNEGSFIADDTAVLCESDDDKYSQKLRRYLYKERIRNNKGVLEIYDKVKSSNPNIKKTYLKIAMYKGLNLFVDLSYYHALFLQNNQYKMDKAINFYFDFLNRLLNNPEIDYKKKTIFIPIDNGDWNIESNSEVYDFRRNLNPISLIFRLIRTNPALLKNAWKDKDIIFVGTRGYFKVDFEKFDMKDLPRFKINLRKLMSQNEPIEDDEEIDNLAVDSDSNKSMTMKIIDKIETGSGIKVDDVSAVKSTPIEKIVDQSNFHLKLNSDTNNIKGFEKDPNGIIIISIDPDGSSNQSDKTPLTSIINNINTYCIPT